MLWSSTDTLGSTTVTPGGPGSPGGQGGLKLSVGPL